MASFIRRGHGTGRDQKRKVVDPKAGKVSTVVVKDAPRLETPPVDELTKPSPKRTEPDAADAAQAATLAGVARRSDGTIDGKEAARILGRMGGLARVAKERENADRIALAATLGLHDVDAPKLLRHFGDAEKIAAGIIEHHELRNETVPPEAAMMIQSGALYQSISRALISRGDTAGSLRYATEGRNCIMVGDELIGRANGKTRSTQGAADGGEETSTVKGWENCPVIPATEVTGSDGVKYGFHPAFGAMFRGRDPKENAAPKVSVTEALERVRRKRSEAHTIEPDTTEPIERERTIDPNAPETHGEPAIAATLAEKLFGKK